MAYDNYLAERVRHSFRDNNAGFEEKKMFGGLCFMVDDKLCAGVFDNELMVRIPPEKQDEYLQNDECHLLDGSGKSMKGFLLINPRGVDMDDDLDKWVKRCLAFNPRAKSSKRKKTKNEKSRPNKIEQPLTLYFKTSISLSQYQYLHAGLCNVHF